MIDIKWLESIATMITSDQKMDALLKTQPAAIQHAYNTNDSLALSALLSKGERQPYKNTIYSL